MSDQKPAKKADESRPESAADSRVDDGPKRRDEQSAGEWFAGIGAGMKGVSRKLLDHVPPEIREKVAERARSHGPGSAAVVVEGAALKARGIKAKLALKALAGVLRLLDSKGKDQA